jgi:hypothetical protein
VAGIIYAMCTLTALVCAGLLLQTYARSKYRLLLWSGLCFAGLAVNNLLLVFDKLVVSQDLSLWRSGTALAAMCVLLYGLVWDAE